MFGHVAIAGLGPLADVEINIPDALGHTVFAGGSETGKSSILLGLCLTMWGVSTTGKAFPVEAIRDGGDRASVAFRTVAGTELRRVIRRSRAQTREIGRDGASEAFASEDAFAAKLAAMGAGVYVENPTLARVCAVPMAWRALLEDRLGRPLRDLLLSVLPAQDARPVVARMMQEQGHTLHADDPLDEAAAKKKQTATNAVAAERRGALEALRNAPAPRGMEAPTADTVAQAQAALAAAAAWRQHDAAVATYETATAAHARQAQARDDYRRRRAELGDAPALDTESLRLLDTRRRDLAAVVAANRDALREAQAALDTARHTLEHAKARFRALQESGSTCPTCGRDGWDQVVAKLDEVKAEGGKARDAVLAAEAAVEAAETAARVSAENLTKLDEERAAFAGAEAARKAWEQASRALGQEPEVSVLPHAPTAPTGSRPSPEQVAAAEATTRTATTAAAVAAAAARDAETAAARLRSAESAAQAAETEAARVACLVDCARRAPSVLAREQAEALGDLGPVAIRFPPRETKTTEEVEILVDGRPWWLASTGRLIVADLYLRAALRRAAGLDALPLVVDNAQDWSGEWPDLPGPVWYLQTTPGPLAVRDLGAA